MRRVRALALALDVDLIRKIVVHGIHTYELFPILSERLHRCGFLHDALHTTKMCSISRIIHKHFSIAVDSHIGPPIYTALE